MWPGYIDTTSYCISWWGPPTQTAWATGAPDYYRVYQLVSGVPQLYCGGSVNTAGLTNPGVTADGVPVDNPPAICNWIVARGITPGSTIQWQVTSVTAGVESAFGPILSMTALSNGPSQPPAAVTPSPDTWIPPPALPTGGTLWTVTNNSPGGWNTPGSGALGNVGCGFGYALGMAGGGTGANLAGGDVIGISPLVFPTPTGTAGFTIPAFTGANGLTWIGCTTAPEYQAFIGGSGGALPAYNYAPEDVEWTVLTLTAAPALGAVNGTLESNWTQKTGLYLVVFREGTGSAMVNEERFAVFTQGATTVDWSNYNGNYPTVGGNVGGLTAAASATIQVQYLNGVTPTDIPNMATFQFGGTGAGNQHCFTWSPGCTNVRVVGLNRTPVPGSAHTPLTYDSFSNVTPTANPAPCSQLTYDRCIRGEDTGSPNFVGCIHGMSAVNCNYLLNHQCYDWGICGDFTVATGDTNHDILDGGWVVFQNSYLQCGAENIIFGGAYVAQPPNMPHDVTLRYNFSHKPLAWLGGAQTNIASWTGSPGGPTSSLGATGCVLSVPWQYATGTTGRIAFSDGEVRNGVTVGQSTSFTNGSTTVTWSPALTGSPNNQVQVGGPISPWGRFGAQVKNHFEKKACSRFEEYGNRFLNCWVGDIGGYNAAPFAWGARDQTISGVDAPSYAQTTPWNMVEDGDVYDNWADNIGSPFYTFTANHNAPCSTRRIRFRNNGGLINPPLPLQQQVQGMRILGPIPDIIVDHCTFLVNTSAALPFGTEAQHGVSFVEGGTTAGGYVNPLPYTPFQFSQYQDRLTFTNSIVDSGAGAHLAFNVGAGLPSPFTPGAYPNIVMNKNLTINDTTTYGNGTFNNIAYASIGFQNLEANGVSGGTTVIALQRSDWDIPSGTYATASTTGTALGCTF